LQHLILHLMALLLETAPWGKWDNARVVKDNITEKIQNLKHQSGKDMMIWGSASIVQTFTNLGLIDEYRLLVCPVVVLNHFFTVIFFITKLNVEISESLDYTSSI
jgi:dihydrofolate reductase